MAANKKPWSPHQSGKRIAGCEIVKIHRPAKNKQDLLYLIQWFCCGRDQKMSHLNLDRRVAQGYKLCKHCGQHKRSKREGGPPLDPPLPLWPAPAQIGQRGPIW